MKKGKSRESITSTARRVLEQPLPLAEEAGSGAENSQQAGGAGRRAETLKLSSLTNEQFEELLDRQETILAIHSNDPVATLRQLEAYARGSGKAMYLWRPEQGLSSLKVNDMGVPASTRLADALRYVASSRHYGIYVFVDFQSQLGLDCAQLLRNIAQSRKGYERKILLLGDDFRIPGSLASATARLEYRPEKRLRLRDGRWVM